MCFSAQASFGASALLSFISILALKKITKKNLYLIVCIPIFFAIQQACEGIVWISYQQQELAAITKLATYSFLFFAFFLWPIWIPLSLLPIEKNLQKRNLLYIILGIGITIATGLVWSVYYYGIQTSISCNHIAYKMALPEHFYAWGVTIYCIATIVPFFISSKKQAHIFGVALCGSVAFTLYAYTAHFTSVWCFFAALLSALIYNFIE